MDKNIVESANYLNCINEIDSAVFEILYSNDGYMTQEGQNAVLEFKNLDSKFENSVSKILLNNSYGAVENIIDEKRQEFFLVAKCHLEEQFNVWFDEIYQNFIKNCLFWASINKTKPEIIQKYYQAALRTSLWFCEIKKFTDSQKQTLLDNLKQNFLNTLNNDIENESQKCPIFSSKEVFLKLWDILTSDICEFLNLDITKYSLNLSLADLNYFQSIQNKLKTSARIDIEDEVSMINSALYKLNLKDETRFEFIKDIKDEFSNQKITDIDSKLKLISRRMKIFSSGSKGMKNDYFTSQFALLSEKPDNI